MLIKYLTRRRSPDDSDITGETGFKIFKVSVPVAGGQNMEGGAEIRERRQTKGKSVGGWLFRLKG